MSMYESAMKPWMNCLSCRRPPCTSGTGPARPSGRTPATSARSSSCRVHRPAPRRSWAAWWPSPTRTQGVLHRHPDVLVLHPRSGRILRPHPDAPDDVHALVAVGTMICTIGPFRDRVLGVRVDHPAHDDEEVRVDAVRGEPLQPLITKWSPSTTAEVVERAWSGARVVGLPVMEKPDSITPSMRAAATSLLPRCRTSPGSTGCRCWAPRRRRARRREGVGEDLVHVGVAGSRGPCRRTPRCGAQSPACFTRSLMAPAAPGPRCAR